MSGAEEQLNNCESLINKNVEIVKQLFHIHEEFMIELVQYQEKIGDLFTERQELIASDICDSDEKDEISLQMELISSRWEQLRLKAMDRQQELHEALVNLQQKQLDNLREWLTSIEDKISHFSEIGPDLPSVKEQLRDHKHLQRQVAEQQDIINSLSNMVVIVDDKNDENAFTALEDQLVALAERWAHVCRFVEDRGTSLQTIASSWQKLNDEETKFSHWLSKLDRRLSEMEDALSDTKPGSKFVLDLVKRLQKMENEMELQQTNSSNLAEEAKLLLSKLNRGSNASIEITRNLEKLTQNWDSMLQRMQLLGENLNTLSQTSYNESPNRSPSSSVSSPTDKKDISLSEAAKATSTPTTASSANEVKETKDPKEPTNNQNEEENNRNEQGNNPNIINLIIKWFLIPFSILICIYLWGHRGEVFEVNTENE
jgi:dystrophin